MSSYIQIIPGDIDATSNAAFNTMWDVVGESGLPTYLSGPALYKIMQKIDRNLLPSYTDYMNELKEKGKSTTRKDWVNEFWRDLSKENKVHFIKLVEDRINQIESIEKSPNSTTSQNNEGFDFQGMQVQPEDLIMEDTLKSMPVFSNDIKQEQESHPIVFISYSWDGEAHEEWVRELAERLSQAGIDVLLDQYLRAGEDIAQFVLKSINKAKRILVIGTPQYGEKARNQKGGVGFERSVISSNLFFRINTNRFIPILREGSMEESFPIELSTRKGIFMNDDSQFEKKLEELVREIYNTPKVQRPPLGSKPDFTKKEDYDEDG